MKYFKVIPLACSGKGKRIFRSGDIVIESNFPQGAIPGLVKGGYLQEITAEEAAAAGHSVQEYSPMKDHFDTTFGDATLEDLQAMMAGCPFPESEWKHLMEDRDGLYAYIKSKSAELQMMKSKPVQTEEGAGQETGKESETINSEDVDKTLLDQMAEGTEIPGSEEEGAEAGKGEADQVNSDIPPVQTEEGAGEDPEKDSEGSADEVDKTVLVLGKTFDDWKVVDMRSKLRELNIDFDPALKKDDLFKLLSKA